MKAKTKKTVSKRFKVTATGKLKHHVGQWNHLRMKKGTKVHTRKSHSRSLANAAQVKNLKIYLPN